MRTFLVIFLISATIHCKGQSDLQHILEFEKIQGDKLSFIGESSSDSIIWQLLISVDNKFKIKREFKNYPNLKRNSPVIMQFGFLGTIKEDEKEYALTFDFPDTNKKKLKNIFARNKEG